MSADPDTWYHGIPVIGWVAGWIGQGETRGERWARSLIAAAPLVLVAGIGWGYTVERDLATRESIDQAQTQRLNRLEGRISERLDKLDTRTRETAITVQSIHDRLTGIYGTAQGDEQ